MTRPTPLRLALVACLCVFAAAASAVAGPAASPEERFRWGGEQFYYSIEMLDTETARCAISVSPRQVDENGVPFVMLDGLAVSVGFFANVYPMEDTALTRMNIRTGLPFETTKLLDERNVVRQYDVAYTGSAFRTDITRTADGQVRRNSRMVPSDTHDAMTWMLDLRSRDLSVGEAYVYHVFDGWKLSRLTARVTQHTDVFSPTLGLLRVAEMTFTREVLLSAHPLPYANDLVPLPPVYMVSEGPQELGIGWFTTDDRRLPVGVEIDTPIGHLRMMIDRWVPPTE